MPAYHAKKRLGQNFLKTKSIIDRVVSLVEPRPDDVIVEIGPGRGALTLPLIESGATVWAVEFDRDLIGYLSSLCAGCSNVHLINDDFLRFDPDIHRLDQFKLIGNLPYNITSPVVDWCVGYRHKLVCAVLMVQRELGARIAASPGRKDWSPLSIFTQSVFEVERAFDVSPSHFHPRPEVTSTVLRLLPRSARLSKMTVSFEKVVRTSFSHRRKTLANNLVGDIVPNGPLASEILAECRLPPKTRAEEVSIDQFLTLTAALERHKLV